MALNDNLSLAPILWSQVIELSPKIGEQDRHTIITTLEELQATETGQTQFRKLYELQSSGDHNTVGSTHNNNILKKIADDRQTPSKTYVYIMDEEDRRTSFGYRFASEYGGIAYNPQYNAIAIYDINTVMDSLTPQRTLDGTKAMMPSSLLSFMTHEIDHAIHSKLDPSIDHACLEEKAVIAENTLRAEINPFSPTRYAYVDVDIHALFSNAAAHYQALKDPSGANKENTLVEHDIAVIAQAIHLNGGCNSISVDDATAILRAKLINGATILDKFAGPLKPLPNVESAANHAPAFEIKR